MNIFFTSDTHFNHSKVITFEASSRPFSSIEEHDEELIKRWNETVRPKDIVWHLGDVFLGKNAEEFIRLMSRLNGKKRLVRGNHDTFDTPIYLRAFEQVYGVAEKYGFIMSHIPLHPDSVKRWGFNVHGHTHSIKVKIPFKTYMGTADGKVDITPDDSRYYCVSVEQHNLTPVPLDTIRRALNDVKVGL